MSSPLKNDAAQSYRASAKTAKRSLSPSSRDQVDREGGDRAKAVARVVADNADVASHRAAAEIVASHYNERPQTSLQGRQASKIYQLRCFNNWVKAVLVQKYVCSGDRILDIGIGKGGDLQKYRQAGIGTLVGVDVADKSIAQACERYASMRARFTASFHAIDCFNDSIDDIIRPWAPYDAVAMQFCMHYAFRSERMVRTMLHNVSICLRRGGIFFGCIPDANVLVKRLRALPWEELSFKNDIYSVNFAKRPKKFAKYGAEYTFRLEDAVDDCPEYLVNMPTFLSLAREYGLEFFEYRRFHDFYERYIDRYRDLFVKMQVITRDAPAVSAEQWEAVGLYAAFALRKVEDIHPPLPEGSHSTSGAS